ncbi:MAG TPA: DNA ligase-associated DEXH box helicase, partial [Casimicrobiaceae bacterium]
DVFNDYDPDNLLLQQSLREVLDRRLEAPRLAAALDRMRRDRVVITDVPRPTPFAFPLMVEIFREKLTTEALEARVARMVADLEKAAG